MKMEQIGSTTSHPNNCTRTEDMMTPTLPMVSARTWRNTPREGGGGGREGGREGGRGVEGGRK